MASSAPTRLGRYEILSLIGKGGMGEVYRAHDPKLGREVAIKVSAKQFTDRFEREARVVASLNHPNICTLFDVGPNYLVMELVEGPTLAERIGEGAIPLEEALPIAKQIAEGLEGAHEKGVVHRDLKPANIKIKPDGSVKVLDFGLAQTVEATELTPDSPTLMTMPGMILGTAAYMAPEQARGKPVNKRADIWAFGVVLYEMVTGARPFQGEDVVETLAAVVNKEPDLNAAPEKLRRLLKRCLEKDPKKRLRDISGMELLLEERPEVIAPSRSRFGMTGWIAAGVFALATAGLSFVHFRERPPEAPVVRSTILPPEKTSFNFDAAPNGVPALSPDGRRLVFGARSEDRISRLWVRSLDSTTAQPLAGTERVTDAFPFWSPDGRSIGFSANGKLKRIDLSGGPPITLADAIRFLGASWSPQGVILFAPTPTSGLLKIPEAGGTPVPVLVTAPDAARNESPRWPWFLPDGRHFLYTSINGSNAQDATIYVGSLDSRESRMVARATSNAVYASGYLLFQRGNTLMAQPFDTKRLVTTGEAVAAAQQVVEVSRVRGFFAVSDNGTLVFQSGVHGGQPLVWLDRTGKRLATAGEPGQLARTNISPDGKRATISVYDRAARNYDLWIYDLARNLGSRFTFDPTDEWDGVWSPDGSQIIFSSGRKGHQDLYRKAASGAGTEELLYADGLEKFAAGWSPDGKFVMYWTQTGPATQRDIWVLPLEGDRKPFPFLMTTFNEAGGVFSPDGRWVAYQSDESGRNEIYLAPFPGTGGKRQVSVAGGGGTARWRADGKELFYLGRDNRLMAAEVSIKGATVEIGAVRPLFGPLFGNGFQNFDVSADGQRFLSSMPIEPPLSEPLTLVQNWTAGLKK